MLTKGVQNGSLFDFAQVDNEVPPEHYETFIKMSPLFVVIKIPDEQIPKHMHEYLKATGHKCVPGKLVGLMKAEKILLYTPVLK